ncbi:MAG TPA: extracellular solute-binding protein [Planctomycetota bacterium]|nr:extracellular solute-binding protein [Planctomycetota bacterium]
MRTAARLPRFLPAVLALGLLGGCGGSKDEIVLYCSVDQDQFRPVVEEFTKATGTKVEAVGETEASRSVGMARRVEMEREHPVADLLWANEIMNTVVLRDLQCFAPLPEGVAQRFPERWRDRKGRFVAFAGRARILLVNTKLLPDRKDWPTSVADLADPKWSGEGRRVTVARPLTGTTYTHAVALLSKDPEKGKAFWKAVAARAAKGEVRIVPSNGATMNLASKTENGVAWAVTDTDDALVAMERGDPVAVVYPDQGEGQPGTLVIPNTVALIAGGPNPAGAAKLLEWLVSEDSEARLAAGPIGNIPLRDGVTAPAQVKRPGKDFRAMEVDWDEVGRNRDRWMGTLQTLFTSQ